eukprot:scpid23541/ scgid13362/ 
MKPGHRRPAVSLGCPREILRCCIAALFHCRWGSGLAATVSHTACQPARQGKAFPLRHAIVLAPAYVTVPNNETSRSAKLTASPLDAGAVWKAQLDDNGEPLSAIIHIANTAKADLCRVYLFRK